MRNDAVGLFLVASACSILLCIGLYFFIVRPIENHPDHMTEFEKAATIKRIEKKLDTLLEK